MPSVCWPHKAYLYTRQLLEQPARSQLGLENPHVLIFVFRIKMESSSLLVALEILPNKISCLLQECFLQDTGYRKRVHLPKRGYLSVVNGIEANGC